MKTRVRAALVIRRVKRLLEFLGYALFDWAALLGRPPQRGAARVALVHVQLLGDGFLWLPYAQAWVQATTREGQRPIIVCERAVRDVFAAALPGCEIFALDKQAFLRSPRARLRSLRALRALGVGRTFHFSVPRDGSVQDGVVRALGAPAVGFAAEYADRPAIDRWLSRTLYSQLVPPEPNAHVHVQQRKFMQALGLDDSPIAPLRWPQPTAPTMDAPYWILAPGASRAFRQWPAERFATVAAHLASARPDWRCVIVGTAGERPLAQAIAQRLGDVAINLAGQTDVMALIGWIAHARLVLGNASAAGHIAAAMGTPAVVVVGGGHWGRCYPYDPEASPVRRLPVAVGYPMLCFGCHWYCVHTTRTDRPFPCIDGVTVETVIQAVDAVLGGRTSAGTVSTDPPALEAGAQRQQAARPP